MVTVTGRGDNPNDIRFWFISFKEPPQNGDEFRMFFFLMGFHHFWGFETKNDCSQIFLGKSSLPFRQQKTPVFFFFSGRAPHWADETFDFVIDDPNLQDFEKTRWETVNRFGIWVLNQKYGENPQNGWWK